MKLRGGISGAAIVALAVLAYGQRFGGQFDRGFGRGIERGEGPRIEFPKQGEFHFVRLEYTDLPQVSRRFGFGSRSGTGMGWWLVDWPDADEHFSQGIERLTRIHTAEPLHFRITDPRLYDNPWVYATQTGWWDLTKAETAQLRDYLLKGGFLVVDDMWGEEQWELFRDTMSRVFPDRSIVDIVPADSVNHMVYDITDKDRTYIPGTRHLRRGANGLVGVEMPAGMEPAWRAILDDRDRMVVAVNLNTDVGDAWEYADAPEYPEAMTALAYRYGVNWLLYAMTH
ncbi:MAG: DUF4159 domain-containing protein [Acidobacteria bacterium]|nr:DUF4159 domain-containing protein [Acidobacteriota bacterium]